MIEKLMENMTLFRSRMSEAGFELMVIHTVCIQLMFALFCEIKSLC